MEGVFPCLLKQLMLDGDERCLTETLQGQNHPIGQEAVHQDPAATGSIITQAPTTSFLFTECQKVSAVQSSVSYLGGIRWMPQSSPEDGLGGMVPFISSLTYTVILQSSTCEITLPGQSESKYVRS